MNAASSRMSALARAPRPQSPRFNPFAAAMRPTLYDLIGNSIGGDAADKLIADFGGRRLYISRTPSPGDLITRSIGLASALRMARVFGGDRLLIPATNTFARRRFRIFQMRADHVSISRIAHELRCTERYVYKVLALCRAPEPALSLDSPPSRRARDLSSPEPSLSRDCSPSLEGRGRGLGSSSSSKPTPPTSAPIAERLKRGHINQRS
jgi:hypothetical protein